MLRRDLRLFLKSRFATTKIQLLLNHANFVYTTLLHIIILRGQPAGTKFLGADFMPFVQIVIGGKLLQESDFTVLRLAKHILIIKTRNADEGEKNLDET